MGELPARIKTGFTLSGKFFLKVLIIAIEDFGEQPPLFWLRPCLEQEFL